MGSVTVLEMRALEAGALAGGWSEESLMDLAGSRLGDAIGRFYPRPGTAIAYAGKGHNAGDAMIALRRLRDDHGWKIAVRAAYPKSEWAPLARKKLAELGAIELLDKRPIWQDLSRPLLLLDGLLGIGARGVLREPLASLAREMEWMRQNTGARVAAVDLPSGVDPDNGVAGERAVVADITFMIGAAKTGLLTATAAASTGALAIVPVEPLENPENSSGIELIAPQTMEAGKAPRPFDFHKGDAGRVAILAGSTSYTGAAVLAATGALRGGAGLISLFVPAGIAALVASRCPREIIVRGYESPLELLEGKFDALVLGCGLGDQAEQDGEAIIGLLETSTLPTVIDADGLNLLARHRRLHSLAARHLITPHPGEFRRLAPDLADLPREEAARAFCERHPCTLLLKGSRTIVTRRGESLWCNSTGSPGMASGGQGDLLAGVAGARLAIGDSLLNAAAFSAWLCGRAAERALAEPSSSEESLTASEVALHLGGAFNDWKTSSR